MGFLRGRPNDFNLQYLEDKLSIYVKIFLNKLIFNLINSVLGMCSKTESEKGEGGKIWENGIETCIISRMKQVTGPGSMHDTGCLGLVQWDDPEG